MNKKKSIGINATLNVIKQGLSVVFPLITYPYAVRVLGTESLGKVSYGNSITSYFLLISMLGISSYSVREGAKKKDNKDELVKFSNEIFTINVLFTIISYVFLFIGILSVKKLHQYDKLLLLQSLTIVLTTFSVDWINTIYEDFLLITVRSVISHIVTMVMLFTLVKKPEDYYLYASLSVVNNALICISNWFYCRRYLHVKITLHPNFKEHMKPMLILFANAVTVTIYVNSDTTMLGYIKGDYYVGLYDVAVKIYTIIKNLLAAIYVVAIPRLSNYVGNNNLVGYKKTYSSLLNSLTLLILPSAVGLICLSPEIVYIMAGDAYSASALTLRILSISLIFAIYGGLTSACLNVTLGREKENLVATVISACLNCGLNLFFIPLLNQNGAAITTLISEAFVFIYCFIRVPDKSLYIDKNLFIKCLKDILPGLICIIGISFFAKILISNTILRTVLVVFASVLTYALSLLLMQNPVAIDFLQNVKLKLRKN